MKEQNPSYPMNDPYINNTYRHPRKSQNNIQSDISLPAYQSQSTINQSHSHRQNTYYNYEINSTNKSRSDLNLNYSNSLKSMNDISQENNDDRNKSQILERNKNNNYSHQFQNNNSGSSQYSMERRNNHQEQYQHQSVQNSTRLLYQKINYLEKQLHDLTETLQEQSRNSHQNNGHEHGQYYEELAIQNAQLTIKAQQLEEERQKISSQLNRAQNELASLSHDLEEEHQVNNALRQGMIKFQNDIVNLEQEVNEYKQKEMKGSNVNGNSNINDRSNSNSSVVERDIMRLNEEIQNLLSKLHNLNLQYNEEQTAKEELMEQINRQNDSIEQLRRQLSVYEVKYLDIQEQNRYLKEQIRKIDEISRQKQKEIQDKYIGKEIENKFYYEKMQQENQSMKRELQTCQSRLQELKSQSNRFQQSNIKVENTSRFTEHSLNAEIRLLNQQLQEQKQTHQIVKAKYSKMLQQNDERVKELQIENRRLHLEVRKLTANLEDKTEQLQLVQSRLRQCQEQITHYSSSQYVQQVQNRVRMTVQAQTSVKINQIAQQKSQLQYNIQYLTQNIDNLNKKLQQREQELSQTQFFSSQLNELQQKHQQLLQQVRIFKQQIRQKDNTNQDLSRNEKQLRKQIQDYQRLVSNLTSTIKQMEQQKFQLAAQYERGGILSISHKEMNKSVIQNQVKEQKNQQNEHVINVKQQNKHKERQTCLNCPEILKEFNIYKELMNLKIQSMSEMIQDFKVAFTRIQENVSKQEIVKDRTKYQFWIEQYRVHDEQYQILKERIWEWEKLNSKNQHFRNDIRVHQSNSSNFSFGGSSQLRHKNNQKITQMDNRKNVHFSNNNSKHNNNYQMQRPSSQSNNKRSPSRSPPRSPPKHMSDIEYDLHLIKLENSTLRSQISSMEKQLLSKNNTSKENNPVIIRQLEQLKQFNDNLIYQNDQLKKHLTQVVSEKSIPSARNIAVSNNPSKRQSFIQNQTIFERYSAIAAYKQGNNPSREEIQKRQRQTDRAMHSADLLINKLKKQNDNLIYEKRQLQAQLDHQEQRYRNMVKQYESQSQQTKRQMQQNYQQSLQNNNRVEVLDRHNIPFEYVKSHPQHKRLQSEYLILKRTYLELDLDYKKCKDFYEEQLQKMKVENDFHREKIRELERTEKQSFNSNLLGFNNNKFKQHFTVGYHQKNSQLEAANSQIINELKDKINSLQIEVNKKIEQVEFYAKKYQALEQQSKENPLTPRIQDQLSRLSRIAQNIQVSPIQSPKWDNQGHGGGNNTDRDHIQSKQTEQLLKCIDDIVLLLEITPREISNPLAKAKWTIQILCEHYKELKKSLQILKGQKRAIMKQRNDLKEKLAQFDELDTSNFKNHHNYDNNRISSQNTKGQMPLHQGLNKKKILSGHKSIPKLNFGAENQEVENSHSVSVISEANRLAEQRRSGLNKFKQQIQKLSVH